MRDGYRKRGPGQQVCTLCDVRLSTNRLAVAGHERGEKHRAALAALHARELAKKSGILTPTSVSSSPVPTRHGDERNRRTVTSGGEPIPIDVFTKDGWRGGGPIPSGSHTREVMDRWCERCDAWVECDGIMGTLAFTFEHPDEPHKPPAPAKPVPS